MHLARHAISATTSVNVLDARFDADSRLFNVATPEGFGTYQAWPLKLLQKRDIHNGTLAIVLPLHSTSLTFLVGGGRNPLYPPNKVVFWDGRLGKEVVELEFKERVRGMACRRGLLAVALKRRVVTFDISDQTIKRVGEWETCENDRGLIGLATQPNSTLLVIQGRQVGHVQLIHLPPCPAPPESPLSPSSQSVPTAVSAPRKVTHQRASIIIAHNTALTTITISPSGNLVSTTSMKGTLVRVWDPQSGSLIRELRRGTDRAEIYGVAFRSDEKEVCVWSDKGTIHVFKLVDDGEGSSNRQSTFSPLSNYLHKYFSSQWSYASYRLPSSTTHIALSSATSGPVDPEASEEEKCAVAWIQVPENPSSPAANLSAADAEVTPRMEHQLIALTYSGGWYRLSIPKSASSQSNASSRPSTPGRGSSEAGPRTDPSIASHRTGKGKEREDDRDVDEQAPSRKLILEEFRRFGRWDGWG